MSSFKAFLAIGAIAMAILVVAGATPASADPTGLPFTFITDNFQADPNPLPFDPLVPGTYDTATAIIFGGSTYVPAAGVTVTTSTSVSPAFSIDPDGPGPLPVLPITLGGLDYIEFVVDTVTPDDITAVTGDGLFLNSTAPGAPPVGNSAWLVPDLSWGTADPAVNALNSLIQFTDDGVFASLSPAFGLPIVPHPVNGGDAIVIPTAGDDAAIVPLIFSGAGLGGTLTTILFALGVAPADIPGINGMVVSFEVTHIPEPASIALMGVALCSTLLMRRRK